MTDDFTEGIIEGMRMASLIVKRTPATNRLSLEMANDAILADMEKITELMREDSSQGTTKKIDA